MFFPTWSAEGDVPAGEVFGTLIRDDRCLDVEANRPADARRLGGRDGLRERGAATDASGSPIAQVGEAIHGGGGYGSRSHIENVSGESIPERCIPEGG